MSIHGSHVFQLRFETKFEVLDPHSCFNCEGHILQPSFPHCADIAEVMVRIPFRGPFLESPEKPFVKLRPANSVKPFFLYFVKGIKITINTKFRASRRLRFEDTKRIMSPEMRPKSFETFEKRAPGV